MKTSRSKKGKGREKSRPTSMPTLASLVPATLRKVLPKLEDTIRAKDPIVAAYYHSSGEDWYVIEGEPTESTDFMFWGIIAGPPAMFCCFDLDELIKHKAKLDTKFKPIPLSKLAKKNKWGEMRP